MRTLRERKKSMLYERTAISKKPEKTIKNEIAELRDDGKISLDFFYHIITEIDTLCFQQFSNVHKEPTVHE